MCVGVSPRGSAISEPLSSLKFADRASRAVLDRPAPVPRRLFYNVGPAPGQVRRR